MLEFNATFIVAMISFIVFMLIMNAILYKPLAHIQQNRTDLIDSENKAALETQAQTEALKDR